MSRPDEPAAEAVPPELLLTYGAGDDTSRLLRLPLPTLNSLFASVPVRISCIATLTAALKAPRMTHGTDCITRARWAKTSVTFTMSIQSGESVLNTMDSILSLDGQIRC